LTCWGKTSHAPNKNTKCNLKDKLFLGQAIKSM